MNNRRRIRRMQEKANSGQPVVVDQVEGKDPVTGRLLPGYRYGKGGVILKAGA